MPRLNQEKMLNRIKSRMKDSEINKVTKLSLKNKVNRILISCCEQVQLHIIKNGIKTKPNGKDLNSASKSAVSKVINSTLDSIENKSDVSVSFYFNECLLYITAIGQCKIQKTVHDDTRIDYLDSIEYQIHELKMEYAIYDLYMNTIQTVPEHKEITIDQLTYAVSRNKEIKKIVSVLSREKEEIDELLTGIMD